MIKGGPPRVDKYQKKNFFFDFDLEAQKDFQKKLSMWEYLLLELYRFRYFFSVEVKIFSPNFRSAIYVSEIPRNISTFVSIFVTKPLRKCDFLHPKTLPIDNFEGNYDWLDKLGSFSECFDRQLHRKSQNRENPCQLWAGHL